MMARSSTFVLQEILEAIAIAHESVTQVEDFSEFAASKINRAATERAIEIISEAVRHLPDDLLARHPDLPWAQIKAIGNKVRHEYHRLEPKVIWDVVVYDLEALELVVRTELAGTA